MHLLEPGAKISTQDGESDYLFDKVENCFGDIAAISSHRFIAQALKTWVKPAEWSAPRIPYMPASCCYLRVRHVFVCGCARENKCLYVRLKDPPLVQTPVLSHELTNCQEKARVCVWMTGCQGVSPGSPGCVRSLGFLPLSCTSPPPLPSSCIHLREGDKSAVKGGK